MTKVSNKGTELTSEKIPNPPDNLKLEDEDENLHDK